MNWYLIKYNTVSGKPNEYIYASSEKIIKEFLFNYYSNSTKYNIQKEDIQSCKLIKLDVKTIDTKLKKLTTPYKSFNLKTGNIKKLDKNNNIHKTNHLMIN